MQEQVEIPPLGGRARACVRGLSCQSCNGNPVFCRAALQTDAFKKK